VKKRGEREKLSLQEKGDHIPRRPKNKKKISATVGEKGRKRASRRRRKSRAIPKAKKKKERKNRFVALQKESQDQRKPRKKEKRPTKSPLSSGGREDLQKSPRFPR